MARPPQKKRISRRKGTEKFGQRRLEVRNAMIKDIPGIAHLVRRVYEDMPAYTHGEIRGQINNFREGCFVALLDDEISIDNRKTELDGKFHIETNARAKGILEKIKAQKGIKRVGKGERLGRTLSFEVEASGLNLGSLMRAVGQEKIDLIWTSPAKKKTGGGG